jgi:Co/Zn/Cd efflux system component
MALGTGQIVLLALIAVAVIISAFILYPTIKNYMGHPGIQNGGMLLKSLLALQKNIKNIKNKNPQLF